VLLQESIALMTGEAIVSTNNSPGVMMSFADGKTRKSFQGGEDHQQDFAGGLEGLPH
jgi:hypothetical protein